MSDATTLLELDERIAHRSAKPVRTDRTGGRSFSGGADEERRRRDASRNNRPCLGQSHPSKRSG